MKFLVTALFAASLLEGSSAALCDDIDLSELKNYLLIGTVSNDVAKAVNVQNGDLGADIEVLSDEINDNVDFDLVDTFVHGVGNYWTSPGSGPDYLRGAGGVCECTSWTGDVALTSPKAMWDASNIQLFGQVGVVAAGTNSASSVSNSYFFPDGVGDARSNSNAHGKSMPSKGLTRDATKMSNLRDELRELEQYLTGLETEATVRPGSGLPSSNGIEDVNNGIWEMNVDQYDAMMQM